MVHVDSETRSVHVYLRQVGEQILTFEEVNGEVRDRETGSVWQMATGLASAGELKGQALRNIPYIPAYAESWANFYPQSRWYGGREAPITTPAPTLTPLPGPATSP
jgi:hypothetical protein